MVVIVQKAISTGNIGRYVIMENIMEYSRYHYTYRYVTMEISVLVIHTFISPWRYQYVIMERAVVFTQTIVSP